MSEGDAVKGLPCQIPSDPHPWPRDPATPLSACALLVVDMLHDYCPPGFMDIGVLTHPAHRRHGLGKTVVAALSAWSIAHNVINQYRCNSDNVGSQATALALGFRQFLTSESLRLR